MLARLVRELPPDEGYLYEPKWDGFRCLAGRDGGEVDLRSRHGKAFARYFPELTAALERLEPDGWVIDGEALVVVQGEFDFESLMARLHPAASRVRELAARTPAVYVAFDLLAVAGDDLLESPFAERRARLEELLAGGGTPPFLPPPRGARAGRARSSAGGAAGV